ncbi:MAG: hypothetical protein HC809_02920 [Gammaproteobacteria bacterium]|nr:hypothetical protein [Gammaproteobacteria bacterium]
MKDTMNWVLDPAADVIWASAGSVITIDGETDLAPTTDEGWNAVRHSAAIVAETGYLLAQPGRAVDTNEWVEIANGLTRAGMLALEAAQAHDKEALFDAGARIYSVCVACHQQYIAADAPAEPAA